MGKVDYFFAKNIRTAYKTTVVLLLLFGSQLTLAQGVINGDFETGDFTGWMTSGNLSVINGAIISGSWSLDYNGGDTTPNGDIYQAIAVTIGRRYELTFKYGYLGNNNDQQLNIQVDGADGVGSLIDSSITMTNGFGSPETFSEEFTADTSTITLRLADTSTNNTIGSDMIVDEITIQPEAGWIFYDGFEKSGSILTDPG